MTNATTMPLEELYIYRCDGLKHIIVVGEDNNDHMNNSYIIQKLKKVRVDNCKQLECVFGEYHHEGNLSYQNHTSNLEIQIHLPALEYLFLNSLPNMISICTKKYQATCSSLKEFYYEDCSQFAKPSIIEFIEHSCAKQLKCNKIESEEILKQYRQELEAEERKISQNASPNGTEVNFTEFY